MHEVYSFPVCIDASYTALVEGQLGGLYCRIYKSRLKELQSTDFRDVPVHIVVRDQGRARVAM